MRKTTSLLRVLTVVWFLSACTHSFAQNDTSYYFFEEDFTISADTLAVNAGIAIKEDSVWRLIVVNTITTKIVMKGNYLANYLQKEDGPFEFYFPDGSPRKREYYHEGKKNGLWQSWNYSGKLLDSVFFDNGLAKVSAVYYYDANNQLINYSYNDIITGKRAFKSYYPDGTISNETEFLGKAGHINKYYPGGKFSEIIIFDDKGKRTSQKHFREDGTEISEKEFAKESQKRIDQLIAQMKATQPEFKGGSFQFESFLQRNLRLPGNFRNTYHNIQSIQFSFTLNEKGKAENLKLISPVDVELERAILDMLRIMPPWDMKGLKSYGPINQTINIRMQ